MKQISQFLLFGLLISAFLFMQQNAHAQSKYTNPKGSIGLTYGGLGTNGAIYFESIDGGGSYTGNGYYSLGITYLRPITSIIDINNANTIIDNFEKWNLIRNYVDKGLLDLDKLYDKVSKMNTNQVYSYMEYELNNVSINSGLEGLDFENLLLTDEELDEIMSGANLGLQFNQKSHILNTIRQMLL